MTANVTITQPTTQGHLTLYPVGVSVINFQAGQTRANNATLSLGAGSALNVFNGQPSGTTDFLPDVTGYFQ